MPERPERIVVFGFESTGKTTLARWLADRFQAPLACEYVRDFWDARGGHITAADLSMIARGQIASEERAADTAAQRFFCDTDLLTNCLWFDLLFPGRCPPWVRSVAEQRAAATTLYLLCDTGIGFTADPQRSFPDPADRRRLAARWRGALVERDLPFADIRGDCDERRDRALAALDALLGRQG